MIAEWKDTTLGDDRVGRPYIGLSKRTHREHRSSIERGFSFHAHRKARLDADSYLHPAVTCKLVEIARSFGIQTCRCIGIWQAQCLSHGG